MPYRITTAPSVMNTGQTQCAWTMTTVQVSVEACSVITVILSSTLPDTSEHQKCWLISTDLHPNGHKYPFQDQGGLNTRPTPSRTFLEQDSSLYPCIY